MVRSPQSPSPRSGAKQRPQVIVHRQIKGAGQSIDGTPPCPDPGQMKRRNTSRRDRIEVLMCDCVSPVDQLLQQFAPALVLCVQSVYLRPKIDSQSVEIGTDCT